MRRSIKFTTHHLNIYAESHMHRIKIGVGRVMPIFIVQWCEQLGQIYPPTGAFKGQLQLMGSEFDQPSWSPNPKRRRVRKPKRVADPRQMELF